GEIRGMDGLEPKLPTVGNRKMMRELVVPTRCGVHEPGHEDWSVDVYLSFVATWWSEGINVYIRDGRVREVTAQGAMHNRKLADMDVLESPVFGTLRRRVASKDGWMGSVRLGQFCEFGAIAGDRSTGD